MLGQLRGQPALQRLLEQRRQQALATRHLDLASIKTLKQRIQRPRATKLLHRLTPTSARHNNIIIIHHASILSNKRRIHRQLNTPDEHVALEVTWSAYQNIIDAYRAPDTAAGKAMMQAEINTLTCTRVPRGLRELITLGRTLKRRAGDILAYFDHPHTSNGPTEAINGRLEHLRGSALGFRNLTNYIARCLLETGGFRPQLHPQL